MKAVLIVAEKRDSTHAVWKLQNMKDLFGKQFQVVLDSSTL